MSKSLTRVFCVFTTAVLMGAVAHAQGVASGSEAVAAQVDKIFAPFDRPDSPGCALAVIKDGQIVYKRGYGMADLDHDIPIRPDTVFHVASVSKQFAAMAIMLLAKQGKVSLDDKVQKYITELREFDKPITIRHLLHLTVKRKKQGSVEITPVAKDVFTTAGSGSIRFTRDKQNRVTGLVYSRGRIKNFRFDRLSSQYHER